MKTNHINTKESFNIDKLKEGHISEETGTTMMLIILGIAVLIVVCILIT